MGKSIHLNSNFSGSLSLWYRVDRDISATAGYNHAKLLMGRYRRKSLSMARLLIFTLVQQRMIK